MEPIEMLSVILMSSEPIEEVHGRLVDKFEMQLCECETSLMMYQMFGVYRGAEFNVEPKRNKS